MRPRCLRRHVPLAGLSSLVVWLLWPSSSPSPALLYRALGGPEGQEAPPAPFNGSWCRFNYDSPSGLLFNASDLVRSPGGSAGYRVLPAVLQAQEEASSVTYCTHATADFVHHVGRIAGAWEGAVSLAVFAPGHDAALALGRLRELCAALPGMRRVSVHLVFPVDHPMAAPGGGAPGGGPTYRQSAGLPYPVNVCRNVARSSARTPYVLVSDVELVPSRGLAAGFHSMMARRRWRVAASPPARRRRVYVLPVFEVDAGVGAVPTTKRDLQLLYDREKAVYFHRWLCSHCQRFPGLVRWLGRPPRNVVEMLEMCLMGYKFIVLDGAFLVHTPGIKRRKPKANANENWRLPHRRRNTMAYDAIVKALAKRYKDNPRCKL